MKRLAFNLALAASMLALGLAAIEGALRGLGFRPLRVNPEQKAYWQFCPRLGWRHSPGQTGVVETEAFRTPVRINPKGLRDRDHPYARHGGGTRVLVLGDSYVWGYGVAEEDRFTEIMEARSPSLEVINAGVSGYSTDQEWLWLAEEGVRYRPDLVILGLCGNDVVYNDEDCVYGIYSKPRFRLTDGALSLDAPACARASAARRWLHAASQQSAAVYALERKIDDMGLRRRRRAEAARVAGTGDPGPPYDVALTLALVGRLARAAEERGSRFLILAIRRPWRSAYPYESFVDRLTATGFPVLDVESLPGFDVSSMTIPGDGHWNARGHRFVADRLWDFAVARGLIPARERAPASGRESGEGAPR